MWLVPASTQRKAITALTDSLQIVTECVEPYQQVHMQEVFFNRLSPAPTSPGSQL